jgi:hypothetical protein
MLSCQCLGKQTFSFPDNMAAVQPLLANGISNGIGKGEKVKLKEKKACNFAFTFVANSRLNDYKSHFHHSAT